MYLRNNFSWMYVMEMIDRKIDIQIGDRWIDRLDR